MAGIPDAFLPAIEFGPVLLAGLLFGLVGGLIPGISGRIGLLIALPVALWFEPASAAVFLIAMHAVVHTTGSVPAVLMGLPTSSSEAATVIDGWPMMQKGRGGEAVGAILAASLAGGVLGAIALLALAPLGGLIARQFTSAEVAALSASGLVAIAALSGRSFALGLVVAALGLLAATVGVDDHTAARRFTLGSLELWDGLNIAAVVAGLFVVPEMLRGDGSDIATRSGGTPRAERPRVRMADVLAGCRETVRNGWLTLRSAVLGIVVGFVPGLGASVAVWLAYGHASASTRSRIPFGEGAVEGVIAPEAANNSKEGGAMLPTLLFAVPGTTSMAILLGAFALIGIEVGPGMAARDPWIIETAGWVILIANLLAFPLCLLIAPFVTHLATLHRALVIPFALMAATVAALALSGSAETLVQIVVFGLLGTALARLNWPRAPFVLGFVIGPILEGALSRTMLTVGVEALWRPMVLVILGLTVAAAVLPHLRPGRRGARRGESRAAAGPEGADPSANRAFFVFLIALFLAALAMGSRFPGQAATMPLLAAAVGLVATLAAMATVRRQRRLTGSGLPHRALVYGAYLAAIWLVGPPLASAAYAIAAYSLFTPLRRRWLLPAGLGFAAFAGFLAGEAPGLWRPLTLLSDLYFLWLS
ncbi:tripartite tricarboxylate transporter permease [Histidinibacterium lentulum]|uniref:DUF112 domain-containing protein n=1 Tax=Histidinibacterium lentulum TaxID=2480588 RepID=A0A3N2R7R1_9RHOB|nr:tripartite tricarboxylate transporter permease [Histidinibacterium lentulum]ROU03366.1 hypothetical protein EAT49_03395 [Histidinibacterium lentulum]